MRKTMELNTKYNLNKILLLNTLANVFKAKF